ncbi:hypothetical protein MBFIL_04060 [Methanobrevibacter filiformis]|uniref:Uncharacterized protein n=2 Tax=Methanobrevibacter filiformis TaxID=55758 RepID=A0A166EUU3_9EURY|nr:hypothetical protein MBFIL_04060 [Methanobrevibacter filiformis]
MNNKTLGTILIIISIIVIVVAGVEISTSLNIMKGTNPLTNDTTINESNATDNILTKTIDTLLTYTGIKSKKISTAKKQTYNSPYNYYKKYLELAKSKGQTSNFMTYEEFLKDKDTYNAVVSEYNSNYNYTNQHQDSSDNKSYESNKSSDDLPKNTSHVNEKSTESSNSRNPDSVPNFA